MATPKTAATPKPAGTNENPNPTPIDDDDTSGWFTLTPEFKFWIPAKDNPIRGVFLGIKGFGEVEDDRTGEMRKIESYVIMLTRQCKVWTEEEMGRKVLAPERNASIGMPGDHIAIATRSRLSVLDKLPAIPPFEIKISFRGEKPLDHGKRLMLLNVIGHPYKGQLPPREFTQLLVDRFVGSKLLSAATDTDPSTTVGGDGMLIDEKGNQIF